MTPITAVVHDDDDVRERDDLRRDRAKERQRERNIARAAPDKRFKFKHRNQRLLISLDVSVKCYFNLLRYPKKQIL